MTETRKPEGFSCHQVRNEERGARSRSYYGPRIKSGISPIIDQAPKRYASRFFQLKVMHGAVGVFLERIGLMETAKCCWFGQADEEVDHLYSKCRNGEGREGFLGESLKCWE